jgi:hypothetical protein
LKLEFSRDAAVHDYPAFHDVVILNADGPPLVVYPHVLQVAVEPLDMVVIGPVDLEARDAGVGTKKVRSR